MQHRSTNRSQIRIVGPHLLRKTITSVTASRTSRFRTGNTGWYGTFATNETDIATCRLRKTCIFPQNFGQSITNLFGMYPIRSPNIAHATDRLGFTKS